MGEYQPPKSSKLRSLRWPTEGVTAAINSPMPRGHQPFSLAFAMRFARENRRRGRVPMKNKWLVAGLTAGLMFLGAAMAAAQSYNPVHWLKKGPTASEQLAANSDQSKKLGSQLQAILPPKTSSLSFFITSLAHCLTLGLDRSAMR